VDGLTTDAGANPQHALEAIMTTHRAIEIRQSALETLRRDSIWAVVSFGPVGQLQRPAPSSRLNTCAGGQGMRRWKKFAVNAFEVIVGLHVLLALALIVFLGVVELCRIVWKAL
jgi:hypothetical protein